MVSDNKRLCHAAPRGKETENKLLVQISEADQVSDFERILNSNAILWERAQRHVWRGCQAPRAPAALPEPRPRSSYSLYAVSQAYHYLHRQHEDSLQPLIQRYRLDNAEQQRKKTQEALNGSWYENLQDLSEFYEEDHALQQEIETITDRIIDEEVKDSGDQQTRRHKNFNVNLASLIGLTVNGEGCSPAPSSRDDFGPSPDPDRDDTATDDEKEWLAPIMTSSHADERQNSHDSGVDCLAQGLDSVKIDSDAKIPAITFSDCCDARARCDLPNNSDDIRLAVPSIDSIDESRPPMM